MLDTWLTSSQAYVLRIFTLLLDAHTNTGVPFGQAKWNNGRLKKELGGTGIAVGSSQAGACSDEEIQRMRAVNGVKKQEACKSFCWWRLHRRRMAKRRGERCRGNMNLTSNVAVLQLIYSCIFSIWISKFMIYHSSHTVFIYLCVEPKSEFCAVGFIENI